MLSESVIPVLAKLADMEAVVNHSHICWVPPLWTRESMQRERGLQPACSVIMWVVEQERGLPQPKCSNIPWLNPCTNSVLPIIFAFALLWTIKYWRGGGGGG